MEMVDLSRLIYDGMPKIPVLPDVHVERFFSLEKGHPLNVTELSLPCHAGTHVDAPIHIVPNGKSIEELPLDAFVGMGAVIGVKKRGGEEVTAKELESSGVAVNRGDILMLYTGWDEKFDSPDYNLHPYLSVECRGMDGEKRHQDVRHRLHHRGPAHAAAAEGIRFSSAPDVAWE
jgi:kynurenine formamidase